MRRTATRGLLGTVVVLVYAVVLTPTLLIVPTSLNGSDVLQFPPQQLSLRWYPDAMQHFAGALVLSIVLGVLCAVLTLPLALTSALALHRYRFFGRNALQLVLLSPLLMPSILVGVALLAAFSPVGLHGSFFEVLATHLVLTFPFALRAQLASLEGLSPAIEEASATLGAGPLARLVRVTLPMMGSGIFTGMLLVFLVSFGEVNATVFVAGVDSQTLPVQIYSSLEFSSGPFIAAMATIQIGIIAVAMLVASRAGGLGRAMRF